MNKIRTIVWATLFFIATTTLVAGAAPFAYVANLGGNSVSVIDTALVGTPTDPVVATVPVGAAPQGVAVTPNGAFVYVTNFDSANVSVIDTTLVGTPTDPVVATVPVGGGPLGVAITPNGAFAYVANLTSNTVSVIDTAAGSPTINTVVATVEPGTTAGGPFGVAITPDGTFAYVTAFDSSTCLGGVWVIDTATKVTTVISLDSCPSGVAIGPNGAFAYVTHSGFGNAANSVSVIDTATTPPAVVATVPVGTAPRAVAITPDGAFAYVANDTSNSVSVIATATNTVPATVPVGIGPRAVAISLAIPVINVAIDIKPGGSSNNINTTSQGLLRVILLSSPSFDAFARVDPSSLTFGRTGDEPSLAFCDASADDVNGDGLPDLVCHFFKNLTAFELGDTVGVLKGSTVDGKPIVGTDAVRVLR